MKREALEALGLSVLFASMFAAAWLAPPGDAIETRSGHGDLPDEGALPGEFSRTPIVPTYRPYEPLR